MLLTIKSLKHLKAISYQNTEPPNARTPKRRKQTASIRDCQKRNPSIRLSQNHPNTYRSILFVSLTPIADIRRAGD